MSRLTGVGDSFLTLQQKNIPLTRILATALQGPGTAWVQEPVWIQRKELRSILGYESHCCLAYFRQKRQNKDDFYHRVEICATTTFSDFEKKHTSGYESFTSPQVLAKKKKQPKPVLFLPNEVRENKKKKLC